MYYLKGAAAGGICCSITHGALTPVDVVKTRVQLDSAKVQYYYDDDDDYYYYWDDDDDDDYTVLVYRGLLLLQQ